MAEKNEQSGSQDKEHPRSEAHYPLPRITGQYVLNEVIEVLSFKKGLLYTFKELLLQPGLSIKEFIILDRNRLVKPVLFLVFSSLVYTILQRTLGFEDGYIQYEGDVPKTTAAAITQWIQSNYGYANIIMSIFVAAWTRLFFRKEEYNFFEVFVLILFVFGMDMLFYSIFGILETILQKKILHIGGILSVVYTSWAVGSFFNSKKLSSYFKAFLAYFLGFLTFGVAMVLLGVLIDSFGS